MGDVHRQVGHRGDGAKLEERPALDDVEPAVNRAGRMVCTTSVVLPALPMGNS
jgi:hypothetical protein